jgi:transcriptional regulator with GAF, ATPase, and Fis domain
MAPSPTDPDELVTTPLGLIADGTSAHAQLHVALGENVSVVAIAKGATITIGRSATADVRIEDGSVSRKHAQLHVTATPTVMDLGSQNGTRVHGVLLEANKPARVTPGEPFHIGLATLTVHLNPIPPGKETSLLRRELLAHERERIRAALEKCGGNQTKAAQLLGISRRTLVSRLSQHQLPRPRKP